MPSDDRRGKWEARYRESADHPLQAAQVLRNNAFLLPPTGEALDIACGRGGNALFLAERGLDVSAWDFAAAAIDVLQEYTAERGLSVAAQVRDVVSEPPEPASFDVITVSYFLERDLAGAIKDALRPGGLLFYETFVRAAVSDNGPDDPQFRLAPNELLHLFAGLQVVDYREHARIGDLSQGQRDIATLVAMRPE